MSPTYGYLGDGELLILALTGLVLVLKNLWDFVRYSFAHTALAPHPLAEVATIAQRALAAAAFPHAARTAPRPMVRRRQGALALRAERLPPKQA